MKAGMSQTTISHDDNLWTYRSDDYGEIVNLLKDPHNWVHTKTVGGKTLTDDFVVVMTAKPGRLNGGATSFPITIQGVDRTGLINVDFCSPISLETEKAMSLIETQSFMSLAFKAFPPTYLTLVAEATRIWNVSFVTHDLLVTFRTDTQTAYGHVELSDNYDEVAYIIAAAALLPEWWIDRLNGLNHTCGARRDDTSSTTVMVGQRAAFNNMNDGLIPVIFQGRRTLVGMEEYEMPVACNIDTGTFANPVDPLSEPVDLERITFKAYAENVTQPIAQQFSQKLKKKN